MLDDAVDESVRERLVGGHVEVAVRVHAQLVDRLLAERGHVCIQHLLRVQHQLRGYLQVCRLESFVVKMK